MDPERLVVGLMLKEIASQMDREALENEYVDKLLILSDIVMAFEKTGVVLIHKNNLPKDQNID